MTEAGAAQAGSFDRSATFRRSFLAAYAVRIGERLTEATSAATESYGNELVPLLKRQDDAVTAESSACSPSPGRSTVDISILVGGMLAGELRTAQSSLPAGSPLKTSVPPHSPRAHRTM